ncbi:MAG: hypothetical protein JST20_11345 [Bacteroidetes bacterium]|nr:hypothetical protein [Bacteroidota bacterium]
MRFHILFIVLLCAVISAATAQNGWRRLIDAPTYGFAANPQNPQTIIVGGFGRTFYRSEDAGSTWKIDSIEFRGGTSQLSNVLIHAKDTNVVLAGGIFGSIVRSIDGGTQWETVFDPDKPTRFQMSGEGLISDPTQPNIIYTADNISNRIFKSYNAGITWDTIAKVNIANRQLCAIAIRPDSTNILLAGATSGLILKSNDSGRTWRQTAQLRGFFDTEIPRFVFSRSNPMVGYTIAAYFYYKNRPNGGIFKTIDGGETWNPIGFQDTSFWSVAVRQFEGKDEVYVGGFSDNFSDSVETTIYGPGIVSRSRDGGLSWSAIDNGIPWLPPQPFQTPFHNVWMMKFIGKTPETEKLYMATDAGFFVWDNTTGVTEPEPQTDATTVNVRGRQLVVNSDETITSITMFTLQGKRVYTSAIPSSFGTGIQSYNLPENIGTGVYYCMITTSHRIINRAILVE